MSFQRFTDRLHACSIDRRSAEIPWAFTSIRAYCSGATGSVIADQRAISSIREIRSIKQPLLGARDRDASCSWLWRTVTVARSCHDAATLDSRSCRLKLGQFNHAIADYDAALELDPNQATSRYGRGVARLKKGERDAGKVDIAAAKAIQADIAVEFAKFGIRLEAEVVLIAPTTASTSADCARNVAHWKGHEILRRFLILTKNNVALKAIALQTSRQVTTRQ
jgi:tetratricopeptide (TPR) repeat protein